LVFVIENYLLKKSNKYVASAYLVCYNIHKVKTVIKWFDKTNKKESLMKAQHMYPQEIFS
jgi:hypothetical protein